MSMIVKYIQNKKINISRGDISMNTNSVCNDVKLGGIIAIGS